MKKLFHILNFGMRKLLLIILLLLFPVYGAGAIEYKKEYPQDLIDRINKAGKFNYSKKNRSGYRAKARAIHIGKYHTGEFYNNPVFQVGGYQSQDLANKEVLENCRVSKFTKDDMHCILTVEGDKFVGEEEKYKYITKINTQYQEEQREEPKVAKKKAEKETKKTEKKQRHARGGPNFAENERRIAPECLKQNIPYTLVPKINEGCLWNAKVGWHKPKDSSEPSDVTYKVVKKEDLKDEDSSIEKTKLEMEKLKLDKKWTQTRRCKKLTHVLSGDELFAAGCFFSLKKGWHRPKNKVEIKWVLDDWRMNNARIGKLEYNATTGKLEWSDCEPVDIQKKMCRPKTKLTKKKSSGFIVRGKPVESSGAIVWEVDSGDEVRTVVKYGGIHKIKYSTDLNKVLIGSINGGEDTQLKRRELRRQKETLTTEAFSERKNRLEKAVKESKKKYRAVLLIYLNDGTFKNFTRDQVYKIYHIVQEEASKGSVLARYYLAETIFSESQRGSGSIWVTFNIKHYGTIGTDRLKRTFFWWIVVNQSVSTGFMIETGKSGGGKGREKTLTSVNIRSKHFLEKIKNSSSLSNKDRERIVKEAENWLALSKENRFKVIDTRGNCSRKPGTFHTLLSTSEEWDCIWLAESGWTKKGTERAGLTETELAALTERDEIFGVQRYVDKGKKIRKNYSYDSSINIFGSCFYIWEVSFDGEKYFLKFKPFKRWDRIGDRYPRSSPSVYPGKKTYDKCEIRDITLGDNHKVKSINNVVDGIQNVDFEVVIEKNNKYIHKRLFIKHINDKQSIQLTPYNIDQELYKVKALWKEKNSDPKWKKRYADKKKKEKTKKEELEIEKPTDTAGIRGKDKLDKKVKRDKEPPLIDLKEKYIAESESFNLKGKLVDKSPISKFEVDGSEYPFDKKGEFNISLYVPLGGKTVHLKAIDKWNNKASKEITIARLQTSVEKKLYEKLNPLKLKGKKNEEVIALIIGSSKYERLPLANYASQDAQLFYDYARNSLGIPGSKIKLLLNDKADRISVLKSFRQWAKSEIDPGKTEFVFYFAGHGLATPDGENLYLLNYDSDTDLLNESAFSISQLIKILKELQPKHVTLILDTCYSGFGRADKLLVADARPAAFVVNEQTYPKNFTVLSAASGDEISSGLKETGHGLFSYHLMKGLEGGADQNNDKKITLSELHAFTKSKVVKDAARMGRDQNPDLQGQGDKVVVQW